jgi:CheY-like chemotaxis protein/HPt (histidine-containing phosphotransfer) domain-containing protein
VTLLMSLATCDHEAAPAAAIHDRRETLVALVANRRPAPSVEAARAEGTLLLLVDDHPTNRLVLARQVASLGYAAECAEDGVEALARLRSGRFGAVMTDCNMPRMDGYQLAAAIRRAEQLGQMVRVPIIACTANALPSAVDACMAAGMDDYITKPASLSEVSRKLERWLPLLSSKDGTARASPSIMPLLTLGATASEDLLDGDVLAEISGGSDAARADILANFRRINDVDALTMQSAARADDLAQLLASAHRIKGASLMVGATSLAGACARIECAAQAKNPEEVNAAMDGFNMEMARLNCYMDTFSPSRD